MVNDTECVSRQQQHITSHLSETAQWIFASEPYAVVCCAELLDCSLLQCINQFLVDCKPRSVANVGKLSFARVEQDCGMESSRNDCERSVNGVYALEKPSTARLFTVSNSYETTIC